MPKVSKVSKVPKVPKEPKEPKRVNIPEGKWRKHKKFIYDLIVVENLGNEEIAKRLCDRGFQVSGSKVANRIGTWNWTRSKLLEHAEECRQAGRFTMSSFPSIVGTSTQLSSASDGANFAAPDPVLHMSNFTNDFDFLI